MEASTLSKRGAPPRTGRDSSGVRKGTRPLPRPRIRRPRRAPALEGVQTALVQPAALRIGVLDSDSGFLLVLGKRLERLEWEHCALPSTSAAKRIAAMRLDVLVVDPAVLGPRCWEWLERLCEAEPEFRII